MRADQDKSLFNTIAAEYARKDLHAAASIARRARLIQSLSGLHLGADARILEIGSGAGFAAQYLEGNYQHYTGLDYADELISYAEHYNAGPQRSFLCADAFTHEATQPYDMIFAIGVLHHIEHYEDLLRHLTRQLVPGGYLMVNEPHPLNPVISGMRQWRKRNDDAYSADQEELAPELISRAFASAGLTEIDSFAQGFAATPFAEVPLNPTWLTTPLAQLSAGIDGLLSRILPRRLALRLSWNVVVTGRRGH